MGPVSLACPLCLGPLQGEGPWVCQACAHTYPVHQGFPDLRLWPQGGVLGWVNALRPVARLYPLWRARAPGLLSLGRISFQEELQALEGAFSGLKGPFLDLGVGAGAYLEALLSLGPGYGVDLSPGFLEVARARYPEAHLLLADAQALPFPSGAFAGVALGPTWNELPQGGVKALAEAHRVLAPGGRLFFALGTWPLRLPGLFYPKGEEVFRLLREAGFQPLGHRARGAFLLGWALKATGREELDQAPGPHQKEKP